jgi:peptidyl-prolyl cis-trans isomerase D
MRDTLRDAVTRARAAVHVQELVNTLEDELASGASLNDATMKLNLPIKRVAAVDAMGLAPDGMKADVPAQPAFLEQIFALEEGIESDPFRVDEDNIYVARVTNVTPSALKPLDQVRTEVRQGWETQARQEALQRRAEAIASAARTSSLTAAAAPLGKRPTMGMPIRRDQPSDVLSEPLKTQLFGEPEGAVIVGPAPSGTNYVVARVADVQHPPADVAAPEYEQFRGLARQQMAADMVETMAATARRDEGVTVHPEVLQQILGDPLQ